MIVGKSQLVLKRKPYRATVMGHCSEHKDLDFFFLWFPEWGHSLKLQVEKDELCRQFRRSCSGKAV